MVRVASVYCCIWILIFGNFTLQLFTVLISLTVLQSSAHLHGMACLSCCYFTQHVIVEDKDKVLSVVLSWCAEVCFYVILLEPEDEKQSNDFK